MPVAAGPAPRYVAPKCALGAPTQAAPSTCRWTGVQLQSPGTPSAVAAPDRTVACHPTAGDCEDVKVTVPAGARPSTLYVRVGWTDPVWSAYLYVIDPAGHLHGQGGLGCDTSAFDKGCGNQTTLPFDELVVADPAAGVWTVRVAAVNIHNESYTGLVSLAAGSPLAYAKESLAQQMSHLTRSQPVNIVFAGWKPTAAELADLRQSLTSELVPSVSEKQLCDGNDARDSPASGLVQHAASHCTATTSTRDPNYSATGAVPYFEPLRYVFDYRFLAADDTWTRDLFAAMKAATTRDHPLSPGRIPETTETAPFKTAYLAAYNATGGQLRGPAAAADATKVDEIDGLAVEDWIQAHRFDGRYGRSFTNLATGQRSSAAFINPDPTAAHDPYWTGNGTRAINVDQAPQGVESGVTFFLLDTFTPSYASSYFRPNRYHSWWTASHVVDPDTGQPGFADNGRGWGGRYRFHILDLGAAPSTYERANWVSAAVAPDGGSAAFDPPIWEYRHNPQWQGKLPLTPLQAGGNTIGQVMGWEITQGLAFKYVGGYLYRPIPNDVYVLATSNIVDHYSLPSEGDLYAVDMTKVSKASVALTALSSAAPYDTFLPGPDKTQVLGCAPNRAAMVGNPTVVGQMTQGLVQPVKDPKCGKVAGDRPDPLQQAIEDAKATGGAELLALSNGATVPTYAVNQHKIRDYIDAHRSQFAPIIPGAFTVPVVNVMFEHDYNVALPLLVGGIAENVNGGEGWGQFDNVNDVLVPATAIDCAHSAANAPGCHGIPDVFRHDYGLTYTIEHESAHFLGLNHPHDGATTVGKTADGQWHYYYSMLKWLYDSSASPTTYAGTYGTYETVDQEKLMAGHTAEYLKQTQDWLADAYFTDGAAGRRTPSPATQARVTLAVNDRNQATSLFKAGDLLHAMYAMRNAALHAKGVVSAPVQPHKMTAAQAATSTAAIFAINPQRGYGPAPVTAPTPPVWFAGVKPRAAAATTPAAATAGQRAPLITFCHIDW